jgi:(E)-4-hydroxy-3-methylbut-2-enyl-diphosphate synthase
VRRCTRCIYVGDVAVGGDSPISVQSMTNTRTSDVDATVQQIDRLTKVGCEIVRVAVPDDDAVKALKRIKERITIPLIADIHFRHDYALTAIDSGVDGIRINPGNIGSEDKLCQVVEAAKAKKVPIRIGVNSGSVEKDLVERFGHPTPEAMVESALRHVRILEKLNFSDIKISVKASNVLDTITSYRMLSEKVDYPLHLGVTEAGNLLSGAIKSAMGMGVLLSEGIGDTMRVSLTADVVKEVKAAYEILANLGLRERPFPEIVSCPTCGRARIDLEGLASRIEKRLEGIREPIKIAVMGCVVNGPGEAREADIGVAGGDGKGVIFREGEILKTCAESDIEDELMLAVETFLKEKKTRGVEG